MFDYNNRCERGAMGSDFRERLEDDRNGFRKVGGLIINELELTGSNSGSQRDLLIHERDKKGEWK
jgi:hypothetical protein